MPADQRRIGRRPDLLWRRVHDAVLVLPAGGTTLRVAGPGVLLWDALERPARVDQVLEAIEANPAAGVDVARAARTALGDLVDAGVLAWV